MAPLTKSRPIGVAQNKRDISRIRWIYTFVKLRGYLTKGFEGGPLTKPRPIGVAHSEREIANIAGMGLTNELIRGISMGRLKSIGLTLTPLLNYVVI